MIKIRVKIRVKITVRIMVRFRVRITVSVRVVRMYDEYHHTTTHARMNIAVKRNAHARDLRKAREK